MIDWKKENAKAKKSGEFSDEAKWAIEQWDQCCVGERLMQVDPEFYYQLTGRFKAFRDPGRMAQLAVAADHVTVALEMYERIQKLPIKGKSKISVRRSTQV